MEDIITASADEAIAPAMTEVIEADEAVVSEEAAPPKKKRKPINQQKLQDNIWGWIFCIPLIVGTVWFIYVTLIMAFLLSFTDFETGGGIPMMEYLANMKQNIFFNYDTMTTEPFHWYVQLFTEKVATAPSLAAQDIWLHEMGAQLFNTVFYMIGIPIGMVLSMFFAVCMSRDIKGGNVFRVLYYIPCVASTISIVYTFKIMFRDTGVMNNIFGLLEYNELGEVTGGFSWMPTAPKVGNSWMDLLGMDPTTVPVTNKFLRDPFWCQGFFFKLVIIIMSVWKGLGGTIILYVAGLSVVNAATKEAAQIDGANGWQIFWKVTMPDLYPVIFYNIVTSVIGGMQIYAEPELLANSSGAGNVMVSGYVALIYKYGINQRYASAGAAYGMFLAVIIFVLTLFQFWLDSRKKD